jgi:hypothetical protein
MAEPSTEQGEVNRAAYGRLRERINREFSADRFVAISMGKIVADAASFSELNSLLHSMGFGSPEIMVVQSGVEYPEYVDIL